MLLVELTDAPLRLSHAPALAIGGLLVIGRSLHLAQYTFALAQLLESAHQLLNGLIGAWSNFNHVCRKLSFPILVLVSMRVVRQRLNQLSKTRQCKHVSACLQRTDSSEPGPFDRDF